MVSGREHIARPGGVLVAVNHLAEMDPAFVGTAVRPRTAVTLATARHFAARPLARLLTALGAVPVSADRTDLRAIRHARRCLEEGRLVVVYPEGVPGYSPVVGPFAAGVGLLALTPGIRVVPAGIWGSHRIMRRGLPVGRGPVRVGFGPPVAVPDEGPSGERAAAATAGLRAAVQDIVDRLAADDPDG
ncbi:MAG: 1-acyl-sn-glycerol-3-phosphate acyltransferase [Thermoleophilia bacterium]|nr:1-acyl-sn-glycerol-3-phosphate acyltransferase [Thermoleophilia bacterium]